MAMTVARELPAMKSRRLRGDVRDSDEFIIPDD
jgi:hypothetical protein